MKAVELTKNEIEVLVAIVANAKYYRENNNFVLDEIEIYRSSASLKGTTSSLQKKGMIQMNNENGYYFSGQVTEAGLHEVESSKVNSEQEVKQSNNSKNMATKKAKTEKKAKLTKTQKDLVEKATKGGKATVEVEVGAGKSGKAKKSDSKKAEPKAKEEKNHEPKVAKTDRKVGDVHPNHPTWIWTEYSEGKFDWRTNPADKKQGQRTDKATTSAKKSEPKKDTKKATNKKVAKGGKVEKEAPKELTIDEFVALPSKSARGNKKPSEAQKEALKLVMKGYRVTTDHKFFENAEGDKKACNWESVTAMLRRYGMEYIPKGLVK